MNKIKYISSMWDSYFRIEYIINLIMLLFYYKTT